MKEIKDILYAFKEAQQGGRQTALATVVHVEGSSYRRPGARMLVEDNGKLTGAISGGCLEGDALRKALLAISQKQNKLVTYNTLDDDDVQFGVQLGCNGIVHILFEPIDVHAPINPLLLLEKWASQRRQVVLGTLFSLKNYSGNQPGTCFYFDGESVESKVEDQELFSVLQSDAATVLSTKTSLTKKYGYNELTAFIELVEPPVSLVVVGAGNDALPLVEMATILGWQLTIVDGRSTHANRLRFPRVSNLFVGKPGEVMNDIVADERTVFVLMTHNYQYDLEMLELLLKKECSYIGTLGPKKRLERMLKELREKGIKISEEQEAKIYAPTGLDIGAETAEEIALSVVAEIKAVLMTRLGSPLRERVEGIHIRLPLVAGETKTSIL